MLHRVDQLKVTLTDVEYDMREMDLCSVWGNYLWNAATVSKPVCVRIQAGGACAHGDVSYICWVECVETASSACAHTSERVVDIVDVRTSAGIPVLSFVWFWYQTCTVRVGHGSWLSLLVCSVSTMHFVDQAWQAVWRCSHIFSCLLVIICLFLCCCFCLIVGEHPYWCRWLL